MGNPGQAARSGVFRNIKCELIGCFAQNLGMANALYAEIMGVILAIECASERNWNQLWIECESREGTDNLASIGLALNEFTCWNIAPPLC
ncbi:ribonuclease H protein, partial [Trifolium medium]|nr:ribonuclease H protein [Trifolium medium]